MKLKLITALVASALAGIATTAGAGVIQASYKNYAAEVFGSDSVKLTTPTIGYSLSQPLTGTVGNPNSFTITWTLDSGEWDATSPALDAVTPGAIIVAPGLPSSRRADSVVIDATDKKILRATFTVTTDYAVGSQVILGVNAHGGGGGTDQPALVTKVGTKLGLPAADSCNPLPASIGVTVKLTNAAGVEFESNFTQAPLSNTTPIVQSNVALSLTAVSSSASAFDTIPASGAANKSNQEQSKVDVLSGSLGIKFADGAADLTASAVSGQIILGQLVLKDRATLYDLDAANGYTVQKIIAGGAAGVIDGSVEVGTLSAKVSGAFPAGATVYLEPGDTAAAACTNAAPAGPNGAVVVPAGGASSVTLSVSGADAAGVLSAAGAANFAGERRVNVCYLTPGGTTVIPTSQFALVEGSLSKTAVSAEATNQICKGDLYNLVANGVKIDVRNYIPKVAQDASGWYSVVRIINTDEQQDASPTITALLANGTLGATASLNGVVSTNGTSGALKPREARYYTSAAIDAALAAAATAAKPSFGAADVGANARLRITAPISSLRVQNYQYNPGNGNFLESSAAQSDEGPSVGQLNGHNNR